MINTNLFSILLIFRYQLTLARPDDYDRLQFKLNRARRNDWCGAKGCPLHQIHTLRYRQYIVCGSVALGVGLLGVLLSVVRHAAPRCTYHRVM